jgi:cytochrome P450 PksS
MGQENQVFESRHGLDYDMLAPQALHDPWKFLVPIQKHDPVFWSDIQKAWIITRHADVAAGYLDRRLSVARAPLFLKPLAEKAPGGLPMVSRYIPLNVNFIDPPDHNRVRTFLFQAFHRKNVEAMRETAREIVRELLDKAERRREFDFMTEIAMELPMQLMLRILGVPEKHRVVVAELAKVNGESLGSPQPTVENFMRLERAMERGFAVFSEIIHEREKEPQKDFITALVQARDNEDRLSHDEVIQSAYSTMAAGIETTGGALGVFLRILAEEEPLRRYMRENPGNIRDVMDELVRYPGEVKGMVRVVIEGFEWHGRKLKEGDVVYLMNIAANTDPSVFERPFERDPMRTNKASTGWGTGYHSCIGHLLAKMEFDEFLLPCFQRFDVEILQDKLDYSRGSALVTYKNLRVRFTPRA